MTVADEFPTHALQAFEMCCKCQITANQNFTGSHRSLWRENRLHAVEGKVADFEPDLLSAGMETSCY